MKKREFDGMKINYKFLGDHLMRLQSLVNHWHKGMKPSDLTKEDLELINWAINFLHAILDAYGDCMSYQCYKCNTDQYQEKINKCIDWIEKKDCFLSTKQFLHLLAFYSLPNKNKNKILWNKEKMKKS